LVVLQFAVSTVYAGTPPKSSSEMLDYHKYGAGAPTVAYNPNAPVETTQDFLAKGPLSTPAVTTYQPEKYNSGSTVSEKNAEEFLAGPLSKPEEKENRGDPKAGYNQGENCLHGKSANCQAKFAPQPEPTPVPEPTSEPILTPDPVVEEPTTEIPAETNPITEPVETTPVITLDLSGWTIGSQGGTHDSYQVTYLNGGTWQQAIVIYDLTTGTVKSVTLQTTVTTTTTPDLSGLQFQWSFTKADGTTQELYMAGKNNAILYYDVNGNLIKAVVTTVQEISLDSVTVPPYYSELYGWTEGLNLP
jgi:hypothetical protein